MYGLELFSKQYSALLNVSAVKADLTSKNLSDIIPQGDLVFSAGLIEHFDRNGTADVIATHFQLAKPGGIVIFTFPTPTRKYRFTRKAMELFHVWKFFDERPLDPEEVKIGAAPYGSLLESTLLEKMPLTQQLMIFRKQAPT